MGLMSGIMSFLFGDGHNVVAETAEVFRESAEQGAVRAASARSDSLAQFAAEFVHPRRGVFDRIVDGLNRLPRPALALGTIWLFVMAMRNPERFAEGMAGLALVPEPLWWLMGAIVSFYFGERHQVKSQEFQRVMASNLTPRGAVHDAAQAASTNDALQDWRAQNAD